jgi:hypothetical protein
MSFCILQIRVYKIWHLLVNSTSGWTTILTITSSNFSVFLSLDVACQILVHNFYMYMEYITNPYIVQCNVCIIGFPVTELN